MEKEQLQSILYGGKLKDDDNGYLLERFTKKQINLFAENDKFLKRLSGAAGICLDFYTNAIQIQIVYQILSMADREVMHLDIYEDGVMVKSFEGKPFDGQEFSTVYCRENTKQEWSRITVYFPYMAKIKLYEVSIFHSKDALIQTVEQGRPGMVQTGIKRKKLLCYGDSITQGYDSLYPSQTYAARLARYYDMELWNQGISGYVFDARVIDGELTYKPDIVTVAYGTNHWDLSDSPNQIQVNTQVNADTFFQKLIQVHSNSKLYFILPLWRNDIVTDVRGRSFEELRKILRDTASQYPIQIIDGFYAVPHQKEFFADQNLHPNDMGMACYSELLTKILQEGMEFT